MKALVIFNPVAGGGKVKQLNRFVAALRRHQCEVVVYATRHPGDATSSLQRWHQQGQLDADIVVAVGGDGTTNEVINGLPEHLPLGVFPTGTANVLAKELGLPRHPEKNAAIIATGKTLTIWPGRLNGRRFALMAGLGYDAWVVNRVSLPMKQAIGKGAYVWSMLQQVVHYGSRTYSLELDGQAHTCYSAIITNGRYYGGSFVLSRRAQITEPSLQAILFKKPGVTALLTVLVNLLFGRVEQVKGVESVAARVIKVQGPAGEPLQIDGDAAGSVPATIETDTMALQVRVPH